MDRHFVIGGSGVSDSKLWGSDCMVLVQRGLLRLHLAICFLLRTAVVFSVIQSAVLPHHTRQSGDHFSTQLAKQTRETQNSRPLPLRETHPIPSRVHFFMVKL